MIGRNDIPGEVFTLGDARALVGLANRVGLGRVSLWSANRDAQCGVQAGPQVSNTCSGVSQRPLAFTWELGRLNARVPGRVRVRQRAEPVRATSRDNPATSPYPIWRPRRTYSGGDEVVWHARVYEAKWSTQGSVPDASVKHLWDTPWRYVGPVLRSDSHIRPPSLRPWSAEQVYLEGDRVVFHTAIYRAKWWTQADMPAADVDGAGASPWTLVGQVKAKPADADGGAGPAQEPPKVTPPRGGRALAVSA
jgi:chitinase